jgi:hypothetical protein
MLRRADSQQLQQAETQLEAAEAVVHSLERQENLAKAQAWKANMEVRQARQEQQLEEQVIASQYYPTAQQKWSGALTQAAATAQMPVPQATTTTPPITLPGSAAASTAPPSISAQIESERLAKALGTSAPTSTVEVGAEGGEGGEGMSKYSVSSTSAAVTNGVTTNAGTNSQKSCI